ncbi:YfaP family protein [Paludisphaera mucosa]|uniref:DUF2135 domain-containing protein n=1 Tax=Paludisphaera mucosa TaxID=3030827 RepID=A0ABT6FF89_9BACT|nr:hypothetical protein [Paludisphaera mucosa]MDG3006194.1 hypothetical protein [Paludisphaera mucosa]
MSTPPQERTGPGQTRAPIPVAYPPRDPRRAPRPAREAAAAFTSLSEPVAPLFANLRSVATLRSWGGSVGLHAVFLLLLAFWYFSPPLRPPIEFDSRIGGSPDGVAEGMTLLGGLRTPEDEIGMSEATLAPSPEPLLDLAPVEVGRIALKGRGGKPAAGGGAPNDNPGAGDGEGFGLARFGDGSERIRGIEVKVGDPQFTLIWDTDVDLDLHIIEPGGKEIFWEQRKGAQGGELDVDNTKGFGPENIYWLVAPAGADSAKIRGDGPPGVYRWFVAYYGGFGGISKPTQWQVRIKHAGRVIIQRGKLRSLDEQSRIFSLSVGPQATAIAEPEPDASPLLPPERP